MSTNTVISKKINNYIRRLLIEYKKTNVALFDILNKLEKKDIKIQTKSEEDFGEEYFYHTLIFSLPEGCFKNSIPLSKEQTFTEKIKKDLNQVKIESNEFISEIKLELKSENNSEPIDFNSYLKTKIVPKDITFWKPDCLRTFISHSSKNYEIANILKNQFINFGISGFVAHKDIEPAKKWIEEIRTALKSMEVMLLLVTEDSCKSWWVNQEIGFALSQNIPIIPVKLDQHDPKGFISEIQAMKLSKEHIISGQYDTIKKLVDCIKNKLPKHPAFKKNLLNKFLKAKDITCAYAKEAFMNIINFQFNNQEIEQIVETIEEPGQIRINQLAILLLDSIELKHLNQLSKKYEYYAELLRDKILSQHTQKRYSIIKPPGQERGNCWFKIIDAHQTMNNQNLDVNNSEELLF